MAQYTSKEKLEKGKKLTESGIIIQLKKIIHPLLLLASGTKQTFKLSKDCKYTGKSIEIGTDLDKEVKSEVLFPEDEVFHEYLLPPKTEDGRPIIYLCNHTNSNDVPLAFKAIKKHALLFAGKQPLEPIDELFFNLNGTIYVDRKDKEDMALSKEALVANLKKGRNVLVYPEGTWNQEDSLPMLEMKWGIIEVAKETNAIIVPMALDYDLDTREYRYNFGDPIDVKDMDKKEGITKVRDTMATLRWYLFEKKKPLVRSEVDIDSERAKIKSAIDEYPKLDYEYEKSVVYRTKPTQEEVWAPIKALRKNKE